MKGCIFSLATGGLQGRWASAADGLLLLQIRSKVRRILSFLSPLVYRTKENYSVVSSNVVLAYA